MNRNELMSENNKKVCTALNNIEQFLILAFPFIGCVCISAFASLIGILIGTTSPEVGSKIRAITAGIKKI